MLLQSLEEWKISEHWWHFLWIDQLKALALSDISRQINKLLGLAFTVVSNDLIQHLELLGYGALEIYILLTLTSVHTKFWIFSKIVKNSGCELAIILALLH